MKLEPMSDEAILEAFEGDFGEVKFDHRPTQEDIFLIKLKLVARKAEREILRQVVAKFENEYEVIQHFGKSSPYITFKLEREDWTELKKLLGEEG